MTLLTMITTALLVSIVCCMTGCRTVSHERALKLQVNTYRKRVDSMGQVMSNTHADSKSVDMMNELYEETRTTPGVPAILQLSVADLHPVTDVEGKTRERTFTADSGNARATVRVSSKGIVHIECSSLLLTIKRYRRDSAYMAHRYDSVANVTMQHSIDADAKYQATTLVSVANKENAAFVSIIRRLACVVIAFLSGMLFQNFILPGIAKMRRAIWEC